MKSGSNLVDLKFSRLLVIERKGSDKHKRALWLCKCDCGNYKVAKTYDLRKGKVKSCGCLRRETAAQTAITRKQREKTNWIDRKVKYCSDCRETLPVSGFGKNKSAYDGLTGYCKRHHEERTRLNRAKRNGSGKDYRLKYRHGISIDQYEHMLEEQEHKCAICRSYPMNNLKNPWHVDHNHDTGKVRGILCHHCNTGLGNLKDDVAVLKRAIKYLEN